MRRLTVVVLCSSLLICCPCLGGVFESAGLLPLMTAATGLIGDINSDGFVNVGDLQLLVAAWGSQAGPPPSANWNAKADLDADGYINVGDLQLLVANWGANADMTAPAAVTNLAASNPTMTSLTLTWTAPGDDGATGTATNYDVRYSTSRITNDAQFDGATQCAGEPIPLAAGDNQSFVVSGLSAGTTYYFALKTSDERLNVSVLSNSSSGTTSAPPAPTIVAFKRDAGLTAGGAIDARFAGAAVRTVPVSDAGIYGAGDSRWYNGGASAVPAATYILYKFDVSTIPTDATVNLAQLRIYHTAGNGSNGMGKVARIVTYDWIEGTQTYTLPGSAGGVSYAHPIGYDTPSGLIPPVTTWGPNSDSFFSWSADTGLEAAPSSAPVGTGYHVINVTSHVQQWVNGTFRNYGFVQECGSWDFHCSEAGSAQEPVLFIDYTSGGGSDATAPAAITNLATTNPTSSSITLTWTAPGDDGATGTASTYDIRYRMGGPVSDSNWLAATRITGAPVPAAAGSNQSMTVSGLASGTTYYFAIKTSDEAPNTSVISNSPYGTTTVPVDTAAPRTIGNLAASNPSIGTVTLSWTAPGDDDNAGRATLYDIRYRTGGAVNDSNWATATQVVGGPLPGLAGTVQQMTIGSLSANTAYYFAIKTIDKAANTSAISNSPSATTLALGPGNNKPVLRPKDFKYLGYYVLQPGSSAAPGLSEINECRGLTHRYVGGQLRFLTMASFGNVAGGGYHLIEFAKPANIGDTVSTRTNHWPDIFAGTGWQCPLGFIWIGLWWDQAQNRLWSNWAVDYPGAPYSQNYTWALVVRNLNNDGTISNLRGPWGLQGVQQRRIYGGVQPIPSWFQSTYDTGPYACGWGGYASLAQQVGPVSLGPTFYTIPELTAYADNAEIPTSAFKTLMDCSSGWGTDWYSSGWPTTKDRGVRDTDIQNDFDSGDWSSPAPDGLGRWSWDSNNATGCWIETPNRQGFVTVPKFAAGRAWYEASMGHVERQTSEIQVFDPQELGQAAQGTRSPWDVKPVSRRSVTDECRALGLMYGVSGTFGCPVAATYDSTTQKLYVLAIPGIFSNSYILIYDVDNGAGPVNDVALAEISTIGATTGKRANTETNDSVYESIQESMLGGTSQLDHKWIFNVTGGASVVFKVKAYRPSNSDGDDFVFSYSTDGTVWTNMLTVSRTTDDGTFQAYTLPGGISGTVYVRVQDTDRTVGKSNMDSVDIDEMCFVSNP